MLLSTTAIDLFSLPISEFIGHLLYTSLDRYALMEMDLDAPDLPMGMLSNVHLKRCKNPLFCSSSFFSYTSISMMS